MKICVQTGDVIDLVGYEKGYKMIKKAGFGAIDWNLDHALPSSKIKKGEIKGCIFEKSLSEVKEHYAAELEEIRKNGLEITQAHAPFPAYARNIPGSLDSMIPLYIRCIEFCGDIGCKNLVIHGISYYLDDTAAASEKTVTVTPTNGALPISAAIGGTCGFTAVKVYYGVVTSVPLTPAKTYTTLTSSHNLDFTSVSSVLKAYIATTISADKVQMTQVNKVPAGTGLVLKAETPGNVVGVPVLDGAADDVTGNKLAGSATETTAIAANGGYILSDGVFQPAKAGTLAAGKAYLNIAVSAGARSLEMSFDDDVTAIEAVKAQGVENGEFYDLQGRRVVQPTKGLYIVNGKKVVIK